MAHLQAELAKAVTLPGAQAKLREPGGTSVAESARFNAQECERFGELIRDAGIKPECI